MRVSVAANTAQRHWIEKVQKRLSTTSYFLENIKTVQMQNLSRVMGTMVHELRADEIATSRVYRKLLIVILLLCGSHRNSIATICIQCNSASRSNLSAANTSLTLAPIVTFAVYAITAAVSKNETLVTAQAFTSVALISLLATPVVVFIQALPQVVQCAACFDRIQEFCNYDAHIPPLCVSTANGRHAGPALRLGNVSLSRTSGLYHAYANQSFRRSKTGPLVLKAIDLRIDAGHSVAIIGPVGSGKSTLLERMLGETIAEPPIRDQQATPTAYCSQQPWLEQGTIRQNIVGMSPFDEQWYGIVTEACGLRHDLKQLDNGNGTVVGSNGLNLSGGQKQRIVSIRGLWCGSCIVGAAS